MDEQRMNELIGQIQLVRLRCGSCPTPERDCSDGTFQESCVLSVIPD